MTLIVTSGRLKARRRTAGVVMVWLKEGVLDAIRKRMLAAMNDMLEDDQLRKMSLEDSEVIANFHVGDDLIEDEMMEIFENL